MQRDALNDLARRMLHLIETGTTDSESVPHRMEVAAYRDPEVFAEERRRLFREHPQLICLSAELKQPGDFLCHDDTGIPIVVLRGHDGRARAFVNACRHRGARLLSGRGNVGRRIVCPYHAWSYECSGALASVNAEATVGAIERSSHGLRELPLAERHGLVWVRPTPGAAVDADALLGGLAPWLAGWELEALHPVGRRDLAVRTNWKLALDTFCEGYHFGPLHPKTIAVTSHTNVMTYDRFGRHHRLGFPSKSIAQLRGRPESEWDAFAHMALVHYLFPNVILFLAPGVAYVFQLYPGDDVDRHLTRYNLFSRRPVEGDEAHRKAMEEHFEFIFSVVEHEDYRVSQSVQRSFSSGLCDYTIFGKNEPSLVHMHRAFREAIGRDPAEVLRPL
jgi:phenylpropionate dioxygenase-like ring-hydroxylating dioxygenase large terminal subunit